MNFSNYRFTLDIQKSKTQASIPVHFGDTGNRFYIALTDGGNPYIISDGCRVDIYIKKPNGHPLINSCIIENNALVRYDFNKDTASVEGTHKCELRLVAEDGRLITTPSFVMVVDERVIYDDDIITDEDKETLLALDVIATEAERRTAEFERKEAEEARTSAENERMEAEADRASAEIARKEAEDARVLAENEREQKLPVMEETLNDHSEQLSDHTERIEANESALNTHSEQLNNTSIQLADHESRMVEVEEDILRHDGEVQILSEAKTKHDNRITSIERYLGGDNFIQDESVAYEKAVPKNACEKAKILSIGGMTYKDTVAKRLVHTKVTALSSRGANLWNPNVSTDAVIKGESYDTTATRNFEENKWYQGLTGGNLWVYYNVSDIVIGANKVSFKISGSGYSLARAFKCKPNTKYTFSFEYSGDYAAGCECGFYDTNGRWLGYDWDAKSIVTPDNCYWITVCLSSHGAGNCEFSNIMFAESDEELPYIPYVGLIDTYSITSTLQNDSLWGVGTSEAYNKIYFNSGKAFFSTPAKCYEFTGDEELREYESTGDFFRCVSSCADDAMSYPSNPLCSHLEYGEHANTFFISSGSSRFSFRLPYAFFTGGESTNEDRIAAVRNWLKTEKTNGTPVTVVYPLEYPPPEKVVTANLSKENILKVSRNGYIEVENTEKNPVPFSMKYLVTYTKEAN